MSWGFYQIVGKYLRYKCKKAQILAVDAKWEC